MHSNYYPLGTTRGRRRQAMTASEVCDAAEIGCGVAVRRFQEGTR